MINYKLKLNNKHESLNNTDPSESLLDWLRDKKKLTGTKEGCAEGDCGACSILITPINGGESIAANSCLLKLGQVIGLLFQTVDDLIDYKGDVKVVGKPTKIDKIKGKPTLVNLIGYKKTLNFASNLKNKINKKIKNYGIRSNDLIQSIEFILNRKF